MFDIDVEHHTLLSSLKLLSIDRALLVDDNSTHTLLEFILKYAGSLEYLSCLRRATDRVDNALNIRLIQGLKKFDVIQCLNTFSDHVNNAAFGLSQLALYNGRALSNEQK